LAGEWPQEPSATA